MSSDAAQRAKVPAYTQESGLGIRPHTSARFGTLRYRVGTLSDTPETRSVASFACCTRTGDACLTNERADVVLVRRHHGVGQRVVEAARAAGDEPALGHRRGDPAVRPPSMG